MNSIETAKRVLAAASAVDWRMPHASEAVALMWARILGDVDVSDALAAVVEHYSTPGVERLMPADVLAGVAKIRQERLAAVDIYAIRPPDGLDPAGVSSWRRELIEAIKDGRYTVNDPRGITGPSRAAGTLE